MLALLDNKKEIMFVSQVDASKKTYQENKAATTLVLTLDENTKRQPRKLSL